MKTTKNIEDFTKYIIKEACVEKPSDDFVNKVMNNINLKSNQLYVNKYKPLISKLGWSLIFATFILFNIYFWSKKFNQSSFLENVDLSFLTHFNFIDIFNEISIPSAFSIVFMFFTVMFLIQLAFIKRFFEKRYN